MGEAANLFIDHTSCDLPARQFMKGTVSQRPIQKRIECKTLSVKKNLCHGDQSRNGDLFLAMKIRCVRRHDIVAAVLVFRFYRLIQ